jgi:hypothetical protein
VSGAGEAQGGRGEALVIDAALRPSALTDRARDAAQGDRGEALVIDAGDPCGACG